MLLVLIAFLMKFVDISKMQSQRCPASSGKACNNKACWQHHQHHAAELHSMQQQQQQQQQHKQPIHSNSSSTSSGCDSGASSSSKENYYALPNKLQQQQQQQQQKQHQEQENNKKLNENITPQQLQQLRYYQQLQRQQLCLLQQQLLQRRRLQQKLSAQGVGVEVERIPIKTNATVPTLTCNQQYLLQLRMQQQKQQPHQEMPKYANNQNRNNNNKNNQFICMENDLLNNNNNNYNNNNYDDNNNNCNDINNNKNIVNLVGGSGVGGNTFVSNDFNGFFEGQKFRRGMTEFSTRNDFKKNTSHTSSQPLQNSPCHQNYNLKTNSPQNHTNNKPHFTKISLKQQQQQQILQDRIINFNNNNNNNLTTTSANINFKRNSITPISPTLVSAQSQQQQQHSPLHYKKPLNSPNNSPFAYAYKQQQQHHKLLQHMRCNTIKLQPHQQQQEQQNLNELLAEQHHLQQQQQQQQLLHSDNPEESEAAELSEESLKQNVTIVLNNLDRYNNALRSIILNEQVTNNNNNNNKRSTIYLEDSVVNDQKLEGSLLFNNNNNNNNNNNYNNNNANNNNIFLHISEGGVNMATAATPESDYNSNATTPGSRYDSNMQHLVGLTMPAPTTNINTAFNCGGGMGVGSGSCNNALGALGFGGNNLNCSLASEQDFTHDNSDYQWFLDYGYRDGCGGMQRSVLSSLSDSSYNNTLGDLIYYEDIAKNLDANLAEVDMESFRAEDINSLLWQLPSYCQRLANGNQRLQHSLLLQQQLQNQQQQQHKHQQQHQQELQQQLQQNRQQTSTTSSNELIDNSICKSEILFSPVKESHISMAESLDMDNYPDDGDIILTCQANKNNYTIAFEGSVLYSDESFYAEPADIALKNRQNFINLHNNLDEMVERRPLDVSMSRSEQALAECVNNNNNNNIMLQKNRIMHLQRYPSGNNNTTDAIIMQRSNSTSSQICVRKSNSLPNLNDINTTTTTITQCSSNESSAKNSPQHTQQQHQRPKQLNVSQAVSATALLNNAKLSRNMLPMCKIPICCDSISGNCVEHQQEQQQQQLMSNNKHRHKHHRHSGDLEQPAQQQQQQQQKSNNNNNNMSSTYSSSSGSSNTPALNLVKLFIKQKSNNSSSGEGEVESGAAVSSNVHNNTCMDVSSGCWPSSDAAGSSSSSSSLEHKLRKKSMNDSGKGSALSKHEEEEETQAVFYDNETATLNSTQHRIRPSTLQSSNLRRHTHVSNFLNNNNNNNNIKLSVGSSQQSSSSEQMTQIETNNNNKGRGSKQQETSSEMITRSMQTSCGTGSLTSTTTTRNGSFNERLRLVPPSFLSKLHKLGEACQAPIYVIYPNYALPDLGFVETHTTTNKPDIIYSSFNYKTAVSGKSSETQTSNNQKRFSANCNEFPQSTDFKHVQDWQSLLTLLPAEHRERVKHLPQVQQVLKAVERDTAQRPLFCMTPPIKRSRSNICDCDQYNLQEDTQQTQVGVEVCGSASSGSSQQPNSSGYRGSSTLLSDSELDRNVMSYDPIKQMYERLDSGVECTPKTPTPPQVKPRGILRRSTKRNSMIETPQQHSRLSKLEKRRSLQEPPYAHPEEYGSQELAKVFEDEELLSATPPKTRLSRRDLDARARAENFLSSVPRSELKYYAEIAAILESSSSDTQQQQVPAYDAAALKKEVSRVLSQQKKVSFNDAANEQNILPPTNTIITDAKRFSTPPNSPNISMARLQNGAHRYSTVAKNKPETLDAREQIKIEHNRFKRLQIQWELMSKDSSTLKELALAQQTQSGGSTPTSAPITPKSRIPRPVSYPAGKKIDKTQKNEKTPPPKSPANVITKPKTPSSPQIARITAQDGKHTANHAKSPSRLVAPKRYTTPTSPATATVNARARTPNSRAPATAPSTPKRQVPPTMSRASSKVR